ncbi:MAG: 8-amino-7-oxononanoate synthase [Lentisphaeria bacterium]|nr:8-amino-7-oxononanoate synthase [Lentisphaeria bacterium]NQZ69726.1 8-amino-7-oxononanoate synthase [Lentisphaeria bacterium]
MKDDLEKKLLELSDIGRRRHLREASVTRPGYVMLDGRECLNLCSNDYLGLMSELTANPDIDAGSTASRLITGTHPAIIKLEKTLAEFHQQEACLLFGSGYLANSGIIPALIERDDVVYSDKLNHASIVDGCRLSLGEHSRYRHNDIAHLDSLMKNSTHNRKLIVTDSIFSMDGDCCELQALVDLKKKYGAWLMVDDAHGAAVYGNEGRGWPDEQGLADEVDIYIGTLGKAYGVYGAYVCGSQLLIDYLINHSRSFIYSTGISPVIADLCLQAHEKVIAATTARTQLKENADFFREALAEIGFQTLGTTHIIPLIVGDDKRALALSEMLYENNIAALAIRPPTVPEGSARIRFSIMASHKKEELEKVIDLLSEKGEL